MELKWITRGNVPPNKKSRVFFCCHEEEFDTYFPSVTQDILRLADCAIWYRDTLPSGDDEEYIAQLQRMQLFVMPITTRLLTTPNAALTIDFPVAQTAHIPVLPLLQEPGLEDLFNSKCGSLMALDKHGQTSTALRFEDKLKRFLDAVLVSDEQSARIRAAFDAYIFLSYRKKDRKYAQELMRLIHKNDFARDIAIWYDEFLVPGEDFNANIDAMLDKSVLFALTVTPNLLEQGNYVMEHEYPAARSAGKPILPIEMLHTDRADMERMYQGLPDSIVDESRLSEVLANALQTIALRQNDRDPEHNFFIGLAYLGGIEVERDPARALALITSAAEAGLPEAMDKLMSMYENGDGIKRDYLKAIYWQEQLTAYRRKVWEKSGDWHDGDDYACELRYLAVSYQEVKMTLQATQTAQALYDLAEDKSWGWDHRYYAASILGDLAKDQRQFQTAKRWYDLGLREALEAGDKAYHGKVIMYNRLSILSNMMDDFATARACAEEMLRLVQKHCEIKDERTQMIVALLNIADTWRSERNYPQAMVNVRKALDIAEAKYGEQEEKTVAEYLVTALNMYASCHAETKSYDEALKYAYRSLEMQKKMTEDTGSVADRLQLMQVCGTLCNILLWQGKAEQAFPYCRMLMEHAQSLYETNATVEFQDRLAIACSLQGKLYQATGRTEDARAYFLRSLELIPEGNDTSKDLHIMRDNYNDLAELLEAEGKHMEALSYREQVLTLAQRCHASNPSPVTQHELFVSQNNLACCLLQLKQFDRMRQHFDAAVDAAEAGGDLVKLDDWHALASSYSNVLKHYFDACDEDTFGVCQTYLGICRHLAPENWSAEIRNNLSLVYRQLAEYHTKRRAYGEAISCHRRHIPLRSKLLEESNLPQHREFLADALYDLAQLTDATEENLPLYEQALSLYRCLQKAEPKVYYQYRISTCCTELGRHCRQQGENKQMEALFVEAEENARLLVQQTHKSGDRRRWAVTLLDLGDLCLSKRNISAAREHFLTSQSLYEGLVAKLGNRDDRRNGAVVQAKLGELTLKSGDRDQGFELLKTASETLRQCVEEENNQDNRLSYTGCLERLAQAYRVLGDDQSARDCQDVVVQLREQSYAESRSATTAQHLTLAYQNACLARAFTGDSVGAADACDKNIELLQEWTDSHPQIFEPPLAVAYHTRSILCAKPEDERWCLEQAAMLAVKYPGHPSCKNVLNNLPRDLKPSGKQKDKDHHTGESGTEKKGLRKFFEKNKKAEKQK